MITAASDINPHAYGSTMPATARPVEPISLGRDVLFAATSVSLLCGVRIPIGHIPLFTAFAALVLLVSFWSIWKSPFVRVMLVPPLLIFLLIHLGFAFRISSSNGQIFVLQAIVIGAFVVAFTNRYAQVGMARYLRLTGIGMTGLLVFVLSYHFARHRYTSFKLLADPKAVFDLLPLMLLVLRRSRAPSAGLLFSILFPLFVVITLLSGERKAYILLVLLGPLLLNFRSLATYLLPSVLALVISAGLTLDRTGYVERQINTLGQLAQGRTEKTVSDNARSWAIRHAAQLFTDNPVIGVGTNGYSLTVDTEIHPSSATHSEWLRVAAENGVTGLLFFTATILWGFIGLFRNRVGSRVRTRNEKQVAFALFATFVVYLSFEALDFIVLTSFAFTSFVQFLRLDPDDDIQYAAAPARRMTVQAQMPTHAPGNPFIAGASSDS